MSAIITNSFRFLQSQNFKSNFDVGSSNKVYLGIGRPSPWTNELIPDTPNSSTTLDVIDNREMLAMKLVVGNDATFAIRRIDWVTGTIYDTYSDTDADIFEKDFYVMTDEFNIYKCIYKPASGTQSTSKPTGQTTSGVITTADGYRWKYMFTLSRADIVRYLTSEWIPVKNVATLGDSGDTNQYEVQEDAVAGTIDRVDVLTGGTGYVGGGVTITIVGDGTGATATATVSGGAITAINMTSYGSGYTWANVGISGAGTGATAQAIISPGAGHGSDAVKELGGWYVMINMILEGDVGGKFPRYNDYRKIFLVQSPLAEDGGSGTPAAGTAYNSTTKLTFASVAGDFTLDSTVTGATSGATGVVVDYDSTTKVVSLVNVSKPFTLAETVNGTATGTNLSTITKPEIVPNSGTLIYKDYRRLVSRDVTQSENVIVVVGF